MLSLSLDTIIKFYAELDILANNGLFYQTTDMVLLYNSIKNLLHL